MDSLDERVTAVISTSDNEEIKIRPSFDALSYGQYFLPNMTSSFVPSERKGRNQQSESQVEGAE